MKALGSVIALARPALHRARLAGVALAIFAAGTPSLLAQEKIIVPLQLVNIGKPTDTYPSYKLGITLGLDGGAPKLYEFDTGAAGFFAAYDGANTPWWTGGTPTGQTITMEYTSGYEYSASPITTTDVAIYPPGATEAVNPLVTASGVDIAQITTVLYDNAPYPGWDAALAAGQPPLETAFWGDFGSALYVNRGFDNATVPNDGIFAVIPQLPGNLSSGFIVRTGGYGNPTPTLQIGITQKDRNDFPYAIPFSSASPYNASVKFPGSGAQTYNLAAINADVKLEHKDLASQTFPSTPLVLDTGAPSTVVHEGTTLQLNAAYLDGDKLKKDTKFTLSDSPWKLELVQQGVKGINEIRVDTTTSTTPSTLLTGYVNTGITLYFQYDVMFDLAYGYVRLRKIPEKGTPHVVPIYRSSTTADFTIYAAMGQGGVLVPYLLDTGSPQTFATYGSWWANPPAMQTMQGPNLFTFAAGFGYYWMPYSTVVTLGNKVGQEIVSTESAVNIGLITNVDAGAGTLSPTTSYNNWATSYANHGQPFNDGTFGNFGGALYGDGTFATVLAQIPLGPGLKRGFIISSGGASSLEGTVTIGLDEDTIKSFRKTPGAMLLKMANLTSGQIQQILAGGANAYQATQVTTSVINLANGQYIANVPTIFDTGGGDKVVFYQDQTGPNAVPSSLIGNGTAPSFIHSGTEFFLTGENTDSKQSTFLSFRVENTQPTVNMLYLDNDLTTGIGGVRVNTGIQIFNEYEVMFDLDDGWLGLRPFGVTPTPTPTPVPVPAPPVVQITERKRIGPGKSQVRIRGTASSTVGVAKVTYTHRGHQKRATGTANWRLTADLNYGKNRIRITATDALGQSTTVAVTVNRKE